MLVDVGSKLVNIPNHMPPYEAYLTPMPPSASENEVHAEYQLVVVGPEDGGRTFDLPAGRHLLGRAPDTDLRFSLETISRHHALFVVDGDRITLEDLGSRLGTFVNGRRITSSCPLANGARIVVGGLTMKLVKT